MKEVRSAPRITLGVAQGRVARLWLWEGIVVIPLYSIFRSTAGSFSRQEAAETVEGTMAMTISATSPGTMALIMEFPP
jgi:hypothetical protein